MTYKKTNTGGKKFSSRQPGEKRSRSEGPKRNEGSAGSGRYKRTEGTGGKPYAGSDNKRPFKKFGDGDSTSGGRKPFGRTPSGEGRSFEKPPFRRGEDRAPFGEKRNQGTPGYRGRTDKPVTGEKRSYDRKPTGEGSSYDKPNFRNKEDRAPYGEKRIYDRKPSGEGRSYDKPNFLNKEDKTTGGEKRSYDRKPSGEGRPFSKPNPRGKDDRPAYGEKRSYDRKPSGDGKSYDKPGFRGKTDRPAYGDKRTEKLPATPADQGGYHEQRRNRALTKSNFDKKILVDDDKPKSNYKGRGKAYNKASDSMAKGKTLAENETRLNRYIANSGMCSRREADVMIAHEMVMINGIVVTELGTKVKPGDDVKVDGRRISPEKPIYILLNKPKGYITTTDDPEGRKTVMELIDLPGSERIYPVGRLDRNTTGVLLLTNDGELSQKLMHPSFEIKKIYKVKIDRKPSKEHMLAWVSGVELEDGFQDFTQCGFVDGEDQTILGVEIHSGRNHIVRRMFEHFGYAVEALDRVMLGDFDHVKLGRGKWRLLNDKEIEYVERLKRMKPKRK